MYDFTPLTTYYERHQFHTLRRVVARAIASNTAPASRADLELVLGNACFRLGDYAAARRHYSTGFSALEGEHDPDAPAPEHRAIAIDFWRALTHLDASSTPHDAANTLPILARMSSTGERQHIATRRAQELDHPGSLDGWFVTTLESLDTVEELRAFTAHIDPDAPHRGKPSAVLYSRLPTPPCGGVLFQELDASAYRSTRLRVSGWVRASSEEAHACFFVTTTHSHSARGTAVLSSDEARASLDWSRRQLVIDVSPRCNHIMFGLSLDGTGRAWLSGVELEVVDTRVALTSSTPPREPEMPTAPTNMNFEETARRASR